MLAGLCLDYHDAVLLLDACRGDELVCREMEGQRGFALLNGADFGDPRFIFGDVVFHID